MAFCTNCGAQVPEGSRFCAGCGTKCEAPSPVEESPVSGVPEETYTAPVQESSKEPEVQSSYAPPIQGTYQAPQQGGYTPPVQQSDAPPGGQKSDAPQQQSYQVSGGYQAPQTGAQTNFFQPAYAPAAKGPKEKRPVNKKLLFIGGGAVLAVILAIVLIVSLVGGNKASDDPNVGLWKAVTASMWEMDMAVSDLFEEGVTLELKGNGKCVLNVDGDSADGKWSYEDGVLAVSGGGIDCTGAIENGVLSLTNLMDMGIDLTFEKEGGAPSGNSGSGGTAGLPEGNTENSGADALKKQWNGTWYGCLYVSEATGDFADIPSGFYDAYMVVEVDSGGKGQFTVHLPGAQAAFAAANCEAKESGLYAIDGTVAGGVEMYAYNWMFLPMPDYPDQYTMGDTIENGDSLFDFNLFMKQWGGSWQKEIDSDFAIVPPSVESYAAAIERGELPPIGFAPMDYKGAEEPSGQR